jgi:hypothetical protein
LIRAYDGKQIAQPALFLDIYSLVYDMVEGKAIMYAQVLMAFIHGIYCFNVHKMYKAINPDKDTLRWSLVAFVLQIPITSNILMSLQNDIFIALFLTLAIRKLIEDQFY